MKRYLSVLLVVMMLASVLALPAHAADARASKQIFNYSTWIENQGNGVLDVYFTITATGPMAVLGASNVDVYEADGTYVTSFPCSYNEGMLVNNVFYHGGSVRFYGEVGTTYYATVFLYAEDPSGDYDTRYLDTDPVQA